MRSSYPVICSKFLDLTWIETLHRLNCIYSTGPSNKILIITLFALNSCYVILIEWTYLLFSHMSYVRAPLFTLMVLFNLLSFWSWNWTLPLSRVVCDSFNVILVPLFLHISSQVSMRLEPSTNNGSVYINNKISHNNITTLILL